MNLITALSSLLEGESFTYENLTFTRLNNQLSLEVGPPLRPIPEHVTPSTPEQIEASRQRLEDSLNEKIKF